MGSAERHFAGANAGKLQYWYPKLAHAVQVQAEVALVAETSSNSCGVPLGKEVGLLTPRLSATIP